MKNFKSKGGPVSRGLTISYSPRSITSSSFSPRKPEARRLKALEEENQRLKQIVGEQALDIRALKAALEKKY